ncbi:hypothetical protein J2S20_000952 [Moryella indoligenes]|uniref:Uncharacterized protein n=1 Tax=Moryella indoligenes TaxID=371674 RepID=A0AAE3V9I3_9FIRM|nr:hypothetical protein [Moryella indoligenes]MDQ0152267.1 hypothetical protein [Moryella indoligenes]
MDGFVKEGCRKQEHLFSPAFSFFTDSLKIRYWTLFNDTDNIQLVSLTGKASGDGGQKK